MTAYAGTTDLAPLLNIRNPSASQLGAMEQVLDSAAYEINSECNGDGTVFFGTPYPPLAVEVNLERAVEHWQQRQSAFGILGLGSEAGGIHTATDSWSRHANKLVPIKTTWGLA